MNVGACEVCLKPVYNGLSAHPCCVFWAQIAPGGACQACQASEGYWATNGKRKKGKVA